MCTVFIRKNENKIICPVIIINKLPHLNKTWSRKQFVAYSEAIMYDRCMMGTLCGDNICTALTHVEAGSRANRLRWLRLPYDEVRQEGGGKKWRQSERISGWGGKGQRGVWNPREKHGGRGSTMMWLALIHRENKSSLCCTTVIIERTGRKWAACSP